MILVISSIVNEAATRMVDMFPRGAALLITTAELNNSFKTGISVNDFPSSFITMKNRQIPVQEISGVICTIPYFLPQEFYYIDAADREYVCAETNAFFVYFLSSLHCKKLNPPSVKSLTGLAMHKFEWIKTVHHLKIPIWPFALRNGLPIDTKKDPSVKYVTYTLVGEAITDALAPGKIPTYMYLIAKAFSLSWLSCVFATTNGSDYFLWDIITIPNLTGKENRKAIVNYFLKSA